MFIVNNRRRIFLIRDLFGKCSNFAPYPFNFFQAVIGTGFFRQLCHIMDDVFFYNIVAADKGLTGDVPPSTGLSSALRRMVPDGLPSCSGESLVAKPRTTRSGIYNPIVAWKSSVNHSTLHSANSHQGYYSACIAKQPCKHRLSHYHYKHNAIKSATMKIHVSYCFLISYFIF